MEESKSVSAYNIYGTGLMVSCDDDGAHSRIMRNLDSYRIDSGSIPGDPVNLIIKRMEVPYPVPSHARRTLSYGRLRSYVVDDRHHFTDFFSTLTVEAGGGRIWGNLSGETLKDSGLAFFTDLMVTLSLFEGLRFRGLYYLHAAALKGPDGTGYLISGNAGSGKTSLTLSLVHAGFQFLSDDTVFLRPVGESDIEILGMSRDFHVAQDLVEGSEKFSHLVSLPEYRPYLGKRRLKPDDWFGDKRIERIVNPEVILFTRVGGRETSLTPLSPGEALSQLMPQSVSVVFQRQTAKRHLDALGRVLRHGRGFSASIGPELKGDPSGTREIFERARDLALTGRKDDSHARQF